jgi:hypothetical protein
MWPSESPFRQFPTPSAEIELFGNYGGYILTTETTKTNSKWMKLGLYTTGGFSSTASLWRSDNTDDFSKAWSNFLRLHPYDYFETTRNPSPLPPSSPSGWMYMALSNVWSYRSSTVGAGVRKGKNQYDKSQGLHSHTYRQARKRCQGTVLRLRELNS